MYFAIFLFFFHLFEYLCMEICVKLFKLIKFIPEFLVIFALLVTTAIYRLLFRHLMFIGCAFKRKRQTNFQTKYHFDRLYVCGLVTLRVGDSSHSFRADNKNTMGELKNGREKKRIREVNWIGISRHVRLI